MQILPIKTAGSVTVDQQTNLTIVSAGDATLSFDSGGYLSSYKFNETELLKEALKFNLWRAPNE